MFLQVCCWSSSNIECALVVVSQRGPQWSGEGLTTRNRMGIVVRSILLCAYVAERPRANGEHRERRFVDVVAGGSKGVSLRVFEITRGRIYTGLGHCGRKVPRIKGAGQNNAQPRAKISPLCHNFARPRGVHTTAFVTHLRAWIWYVFWPPRFSIRVVSPLFALNFKGEATVKP